MHRLIKSHSVKSLLICEAPSLIISLAIASVFYKFGSFLFEFLAFLPTWYLVGFLIERIGARVGLIDTDT